MSHPKIDRLIELFAQATPGTWGPTTAPPKAAEDVTDRVYVKDGERGEPQWSAVVSDGEEIAGVDHPRYAGEHTHSEYWEHGTDLYGGVLIGESLQGANGEFIAENHNTLPALLRTIGVLSLALSAAAGEKVVELLVNEAMEDDQA